jgi:hypothetical protein
MLPRDKVEEHDDELEGKQEDRGQRAGRGRERGAGGEGASERGPPGAKEALLMVLHAKSAVAAKLEPTTVTRAGARAPPNGILKGRTDASAGSIKYCTLALPGRNDRPPSSDTLMPTNMCKPSSRVKTVPSAARGTCSAGVVHRILDACTNELTPQPAPPAPSAAEKRQRMEPVSERNSPARSTVVPPDSGARDGAADRMAAAGE